MKDQAELARLGGVSRARLTQIMNLLNFAPAIQEKLLFLEAGVELSERELRVVAARAGWGEQQLAWIRRS